MNKEERLQFIRAHAGRLHKPLPPQLQELLRELKREQEPIPKSARLTAFQEWDVRDEVKRLQAYPGPPTGMDEGSAWLGLVEKGFRSGQGY